MVPVKLSELTGAGARFPKAPNFGEAVKSTLAAAQLEGFDAVGIEVHEDICSAAAERLQVPIDRI